ncbi:MAG: GTP-binding protein, partial [Pseudomonadota bacterium]
MTDHRSLSFVVVGHVDHGKSTLIGRLMHDTDSLPDGKLEELKAVSERRGMPLEWSFVLDAFQAERDQAITIDSTQIRFATEKRDYVIIDAPGHREFLRNMLSGAALADAAVLVIDGAEGVQEQTRRHAYLLHLLGLSEVAVVVNKMDIIGYSAARFHEVENDVKAYLSGLGISPRAVIPICAREGDNLATQSTKMDWYEGECLVEVLDRFSPRRPAVEAPLRISVQDIYRHDDRRIIVGRVESGIVRAGETLVFSPNNESAKVETIEQWGADQPPLEVRAGQPIGFTIDQRLFVERGDVASHEDGAPILTNVFRCHLFWFGRTPLRVGDSYMLKVGTKRARVSIEAIEKTIDTNSLDDGTGDQVTRGGVAEIVLRSQSLLAIDSHQDHPRTGRCVLVDGFETVGAGALSTEGYPDQRQGLHAVPANIFTVDHKVTADARTERNGHRGAVIWLTGLSGAGKSTLA